MTPVTTKREIKFKEALRDLRHAALEAGLPSSVAESLSSAVERSYRDTVEELTRDAPYPCTVTTSRYGGAYERGAWVAFPLEIDEVPLASRGDDDTADAWWQSPNADCVGRGETPAEAVNDMLVRAKRRKK